MRGDNDNDLCLALYGRSTYLLGPDLAPVGSRVVNDTIPEVDPLPVDLGLLYDLLHKRNRSLAFTDNGGGPRDFIGDPVLEAIKFYLTGVVNPALCVFGLIGNVFNVLVLSRRRMKAVMDSTMEQAAHTGLVALSVSDVLYCASALFHGLLSRHQTAFQTRSIWLYVQIYGPYLQNTFLHTGAWLTVIMAAGRYAAICRPIEARYLLGVNCTRISVAFTFVFWAAFQLPIIWTYQVVTIECPPSDELFLLDQGHFVLNGILKMTFTYAWAIIGFFLPVLLLAYCNFHLIRALRESYRIRRLYRVSAKMASCGHRVTATLVAVVCMFLTLITPSEILHFYYYAVRPEMVEIVTTAIVATNVLQTINFAFNFVLYCIVNVHFREAWKELIYCAGAGRRSSDLRGSRRTTQYITRNLSTVALTKGSSRRHNTFETVM